MSVWVERISVQECVFMNVHELSVRECEWGWMCIVFQQNRESQQCFSMHNKTVYLKTMHPVLFGTWGNEAGTFTLNRYVWGAVQASHCIFFTKYSHNTHSYPYRSLGDQEGRRYIHVPSPVALALLLSVAVHPNLSLRTTEAASQKRYKSGS